MLNPNVVPALGNDMWTKVRKYSLYLEHKIIRSWRENPENT